MILKMDMEKAFDKISWNFLMQALDRFGFPSVWCDRILALISGSSFAILVNGTLSRWVNASAGIRQGCPLSPSLFILCSEVLSRFFNQEARLNNLRGLRLSRSSPPITHLFYADDIVVMAEASVANGETLLQIFNRYCALSGQSWNKEKSVMVVSRRASAGLRSDLHSILGIRLAKELGNYLGVPLVAGILRTKHFAPLQARIAKKLNGGKICPWLAAFAW